MLDGLFSAASSEERKYWGFQVFTKVLNEAPIEFASSVFTKNFMRSLMNQLAGEDRYLHKVATKASKSIQARVSREPQFLAPAILGLMGPTGAVNFDQLTKTKTVEKLLGDVSVDALANILPFLADMIANPGVDDTKFAESIRQQLSGHMFSMVKSQSAANKTESDEAESVIYKTMLVLARFAYFVPTDSSKTETDVKRPDPPMAHATQELFRNRLLSCLNVLMGGKKNPASVTYKLVRKIRDLAESEEYGRFVIEMDESISGPLASAFKTLKKINRKVCYTPRRATPSTTFFIDLGPGQGRSGRRLEYPSVQATVFHDDTPGV
jgi:DNA polymerase phi